MRRGLITVVIVRVPMIAIGIPSEGGKASYSTSVSTAVVVPFHRLDDRDSGCDCRYGTGFRLRTFVSSGDGRRNRCFESLGRFQFDIARGRLNVLLTRA